MSHKLHRLTSSLYNTPLLIEQNAFKGILGYLAERNESGIKAEAQDDDDLRDYRRFVYNEDTQTGVIEFIGPTTAKPITFIGFDCGGANYLHLKQDFESLIGLGAKTIAMIVDSPGGEAYSMSDSANYIRKLLDDNDVKLITYVEGMAASAGYGITCISDEIIGSWDSEFGSIGVLVQLWNDSKALEKEGYERSFVSAGKSKVPWEADGSFREGFIQDIQDKVDTCYENFTNHVATHRDMKVSDVIATEARMFFAEDAIKLGLADKLMTQEEFFTYLATVSETNVKESPVAESSTKDRIFKFMNVKENAEMAKLEELQTQLEAQQTAHATKLLEASELITSLTAQLEGFKEAQALAEQAAATAKLESRKASLSEVMPAEQVETRLSAYAALDDNTFAFMVSELQTAKDARAESFKPAGEEGAEAEQTQLSATDAILKAGVEAAKARR